METSEGKLSDANKFLELVRRFTERETLDQEILNTLIDRIEVNEKEHTDNGVVQNICIYYKFVGKIKTI